MTNPMEIYLTEDERQLLTSLANVLADLEVSALRRSEGPEAQTYAAAGKALRKLLHPPAAELAEHWKQVAIRLDDEKHQAQDEVTRCSAIALENARERDAAQLERDALRARLAETSKLLETECSLSMNTTNAMFKAQAERDVLRAMLCDLPASAHPHPVEHPTMAAQWARARELIKGGPPATPGRALDPAGDLTPEQLDGMDLEACAVTRDNKPSIAELQRVIAVMYEGRATCDLVADPGSRRVSVRVNGAEVDEIWLDTQWIAAGLVAEHNATPVLLEIVAAALALESFTIGTAARRSASKRYYAALAKVRP